MFKSLVLLFVLVGCASKAHKVKSLYEGKLHDGKDIIIDLKEKSHTVFIFMSSRCPCSESHNDIIKSLSKEYKNVNFVGVHSNYNEKIGHVKKYFKGLNFNFPILYDIDSKLAKEFGAVKTPHVFILNSSSKTVYSGNITNSSNGRTAKVNHLKIALDDIKSGIEPLISRRKSLGCYIPIKKD